MRDNHDNKEHKSIDIDINIDKGPKDLGYQGPLEKQQETSSDELKQQAGELLKAAGGFAGSLGKLAAKKGSALKDKISDEEFQEKVKSGAKSYADKAGAVISSGATKAGDAIKESTASVKVRTANNKQQLDSTKTSTTTQGSKKGNQKLGIVLLAVGLAIAGVIAAFSGGNDERPANEAPVAEENVEETTANDEQAADSETTTVNDEQTADSETTTANGEQAADSETTTANDEQVVDSETTEEPSTVYYSTNTEDTVKDGNKGIYSYKNKGGSYDVYYIIDFDEEYVYSFTDGNGEDGCDKVKIDSGDLNDVVMVTYDFDGDLAPYGLHFKYKDNPEHLIVQDNDGFELDFYPTGLSDALAIRDGKTITER